MRTATMHLAQFLCHSPTYHSLAMWRQPRTATADYDWQRPELYQHIARTCERGRLPDETVEAQRTDHLLRKHAHEEDQHQQADRAAQRLTER